MKKITILSVPFFLLSSNYGSLFQAYALKYVLEHWFSCNVTHIHWSVVKKGPIKRVLLSFLVKLFVHLSPDIIKHFIPFSLFPSSLTRLFYPKNFSPFLNKHLAFTPELGISDFKLRHWDSNATYIVGSDQVWGFDTSAVLLDFIPAGDKIAYAASAPWGDRGGGSILRKKKSLEYLKAFRSISVRENAGKECLSSLLPNHSIEVVLDPTLLLQQDHYSSFLMKETIFSRPTLLCYFLNITNDREWPISLSNLIQVSKQKDLALRIIPLQGTERMIPRKYGFNPPPEDFLRAFRDATYVLTNSFHGTVFSIIFNTPFVAYTQIGHGATQNSRIQTLLEGLDLSSRIAEPGTDTSIIIELLVHNPILWEQVEQRLSPKRIQSLNFLSRALHTPVPTPYSTRKY